MNRIVIVGSGNVAYAFANVLNEKGTPPVQIFSRNREAAREIADMCGAGFASGGPELAPADLYIIAVADQAIEQVASSLDFGNALVAHTSASTPLDALQNIPRRSVIYPLQTFTKSRKVDFSDVPILVEAASQPDLEAVKAFAESLSGDVRVVDSARRALIHIAAVFAGNFTNYMYTVGEELAADAGLDFSILKPLIRETAEKAVATVSPTMTQTGPAVRNDFRTKSHHCELLFEKPDLKNIYINLSNNIWETSKKISQK